MRVFSYFADKMGRKDLDYEGFCVVMNDVGVLSAPTQGDTTLHADTLRAGSAAAAASGVGDDLLGVSPSGMFQMFQPDKCMTGVITAQDFVEGFLKIRGKHACYVALVFDAFAEVMEVPVGNGSSVKVGELSVLTLMFPIVQVFLTKRALTVLIFFTALALVVLVFLTALAPTVLVFLTVLICLTEHALTVLIFLAKLALSVLVFLTKFAPVY